MADYHCAECRGTNVEICLPAHFELNKDLELVSIDYEAEALTYFCRDCGEDVAIIDYVDDREDGVIRSGRW